MNLTLTLSLTAIAELIMLIAVVIDYVKLRNENSKNKKMYNNLKESMQKIEENITNANKEKEKLNTGDDDVNFNNAVDILHKYAQKRKTES